MERPQLRALARACGIMEEFWATDGSRRRVSDATCKALLATMGIDASGESAAGEALRTLQVRERARWLAPVHVVRADLASTIRGCAPRAWWGRSVKWSLVVGSEDGPPVISDGSGLIGSRGSIDLPHPALARGTHESRLLVEGEGDAAEARQWIVAAPAACVDVESRLGQRRAFGLWAHVYALSKSADLGIGDLGHLEDLVCGVAENGGAFIATQPWHTLGNTWQHTSPYSPVSRLYRNPIYLDLQAVPELRGCRAAQRALQDFEVVGKLDALRHASRIDYEAVMHVKRFVLERLFEEFQTAHLSRGTARARAYRNYVSREGASLRSFAAYSSLGERLGGTYCPTTDWRKWPSRFHDPQGSPVRDFVREATGHVEFHCWLQFELDRQLAAVAAAGAKRGLALGLVGDLALGSGRGSADTWLHRDLFVETASLGAPPDAFAKGQDWDLPPLHPVRSQKQGHAYLRGVLHSAFEHMGAVRVDHVMGLFRQFWIPAGRSPAEGAYVTMPSRELLALLAIESHNHKAVVIGEDLGTRPPALAPRLAQAQILSTRVLPFERTRTGFRAATRYGARAYVTAHTHDLPPLLGWCRARDLALRFEGGEMQEPDELEAARQARCRALAALRRRLHRDGLLGDASVDVGDAELAGAVTAFLASTAAPLLALSVDDLVGETEPLNLPASDLTGHVNWSHRMDVRVGEIRHSATAAAMLAAIPRDRRLSPPQRQSDKRGG